MTDRLTFKSAVFTLLKRENEVLFLRRAHTGWMDGFYEPTAGHLESGETLQEGAAREVKEETGVVVEPHDLKLKHIYQTYSAKDGMYIGFIFLAVKWEGEPEIKEPEKCDDMRFFDLDNLPNKITPYTKAALGSLDKNEVSYSSHDEASLAALSAAAEKF